MVCGEEGRGEEFRCVCMVDGEWCLVYVWKKTRKKKKECELNVNVLNSKEQQDKLTTKTSFKVK